MRDHEMSEEIRWATKRLILTIIIHDWSILREYPYKSKKFHLGPGQPLQKRRKKIERWAETALKRQKNIGHVI